MSVFSSMRLPELRFVITQQ